MSVIELSKVFHSKDLSHDTLFSERQRMDCWSLDQLGKKSRQICFKVSVPGLFDCTITRGMQY